MPGSVIEMVRNANRTRQPEASVALRGSVLAAVMTGALALAAEQAISALTAALLVILLPFSYWVSYVRREKDNWHIKIALTFLAIFALVRFFGQLRGITTLDEVRFPLADLFLWVQVLHGFDLPARKDLNFSLGSSLTLMAAAGSISQSMTFALFAVAYFVFAIVALALVHRSELAEGAAATVIASGEKAPRWGIPGTRELGRVVLITAVAAGLLFMVLPQPSGARTFGLPFNLGGGIGAIPSEGTIANPGFEGSGGPGGTRSNGTAFFGFNDRMDLRVRGDLNDELVMRVRASAPAMWKGVVFDTYDGIAWDAPPGDEAEPLGFEAPFFYPARFRSLGPRSTVAQTFYIETEQPSVLFAAGQPDQIWVPGGVNIDAVGGLRLPATLTEGTVYSVVSSRGAATPQELRSLPTEQIAPDHDFQRYLQLPEDLPDRVRELAVRITRDATNTYDKVKAIETWLADNYRYDTESPVPEEGRDAVDHFLFDTDVGFCEQFASATAVMLRSLGIPARVIAGYTPGYRNPFTGYYEVHNSDAHAWVEVWFPNGFGWYEFDPTFAIPPAEPDLSSSIPVVRAFEFVAGKIGSLGGLKGTLRVLAILAIVATVVVAGWVAYRRLRPAPKVRGATERLAGGPVTRAFRRFEDALAARGSGRAPPETAAEVMRRAVGSRDPEARTALRVFERERYGSRPPSPDEAEEAIRHLDRLAERDGAV